MPELSALPPPARCSLDADMTVGQWLDAQIALLQSVPFPRHVQLTMAIALLPLVVFHLVWKLVLEDPREKAVRFTWSIPVEASSVRDSAQRASADLEERCRPGWRSKALDKPSIHAHLDDPSLLPSIKAPPYITAYAPASGHHLETLPAHTAAEISASIARAEVAQVAWGKSDWCRRRKVMKSLLDWCVRDMEAIARVSSRDTGKTRESNLLCAEKACLKALVVLGCSTRASEQSHIIGADVSACA